MVADGSGLKIYDLGEEWFRLTSLPFVWALWIGRTDLSSAVSSRLKAAKEVGAKSLEQIIAKAETESKWPDGRCETYLRQTMRYDLGDADLAGLRAYQELLVKHRVLEEAFFPARVSVDQSFLATM